MNSSQAKRQAAALSVGSNSFLVLSKLVIGVVTHSVAVISEAVHSVMDLAASLIAYVAVTFSDRPPDREHPHGHGKIESLSGAIEALLIFMAVFFIAYEAIERLIRGGEVERIYLGSVVMGLSAAVNTAVSWYLQRIGRRTDSEALLADAAHLRTDVYTSLGVLSGLLVVHFTREQWLDPATALGVGLLISREAWQIVRRSVGNLLDRSLPEEEQRLVEQAITQSGASFHDLRSRKSGSTRSLDLHLEVSPSATASEVHELCDRIEQSVGAALPGTEVLIHPEPTGEHDLSAVARETAVQVLEQHAGLFRRYTDLEVTSVGGKVQVVFRLEVESATSLEQLEEIRRKLTRQICERVSGVQVYIEARMASDG